MLHQSHSFVLYALNRAIKTRVISKRMTLRTHFDRHYK